MSVDDRAVLLLCALHSAGFAVFHLAFWRLFDWPADLRGCSRATRAITQILNLRLAYVFAGIAALCLALPDELLGTRLGRAVLGGMSLFWAGRLVEQWVFLRLRHPLVRATSLLFAVGILLFAWPLFR